MQVYGASKLYNIMIAKALNEKLKGTGVEAFSAHPGVELERLGRCTPVSKLCRAVQTKSLEEL